ncbi:MAG TPA: polyprenyl synthetase family protein [Spirochaetota bacterium]|nr:polyprenyl synthetase family protein [Spirochaetota bacterium]
MKHGTDSIMTKPASEENYFSSFSSLFVPKIDGFMKSYFQKKKVNPEYDFISGFYDDLEEYSLRNGKRVRPLLLLLAFAGYSESGKGTGEIVKIAAVLEIMHNFLLIQDDIIDRSELRRGEKTLHILCGEKYGHLTGNRRIGSDVALILADVLFANAVEIIADAKIDIALKNEFLKLFARTYEMTAWGQILDCLCSLPAEISDTSIPDKIGTIKTAYYTVYYPMMMGLLLSGKRSKTEERRIRDFALPLGLAFQVRDDILGVFGSSDDIGKSSESDLVEGKLTHLIIDTLATLGEHDKKLFTEVFGKEEKSRKDISYLQKKVSESGCRERSQERLSCLVEESRRALLKCGIDGKGKKRLGSFIDMVSKAGV